MSPIDESYSDGYADGRNGSGSLDLGMSFFKNSFTPEYIEGYEAGRDDRAEHGSLDDDDN